MVLNYYLGKKLNRFNSVLAGRVTDLATLKVIANTESLVFTSLSLFQSGLPHLSQYFAVEDQTLASKQRILQVAASMAMYSSADLTQAIYRSAKEAGLPLREIEIDPVAVSGLMGKLDRTWYVLGDESVMKSEAIELGVTSRALMQQLEMNGNRILFLAQKQPKRLLGIFACEQPIKTGSEEAVQNLKDLGLELSLLTSEKTRVTKALTARLGIESVTSELSEEQKRSLVSVLLEKNPLSGFVGLPKDLELLKLSSFSVAISPRALSEVLFSLKDLNEVSQIIIQAREELASAKKVFFWCKL